MALSKRIISNSNNKFFPWFESLIILPIIIFYTVNRGDFTFVDYVNLLVHEGGHGVFSFFGKFLHALGGTLMQIIIPTMFVVYYWIHSKKLAAQIFLVWLGENLINISVYAADARAKKLHLLGGNKVYHDWNYLLRTTGLLENDIIVGDIIYVLGVIIFLIALLVPLFIKDKNARINLELNL